MQITKVEFNYKKDKNNVQEKRVQFKDKLDFKEYDSGSELISDFSECNKINKNNDKFDYKVFRNN